MQITITRMHSVSRINFLNSSLRSEWEGSKFAISTQKENKQMGKLQILKETILAVWSGRK